MTTETTLKRCVAIAYEWFVTPVDFADYDIALVVSCHDTRSSETSSTTYHAKLPGKQSVGQQTDVSGNLGIVFPVTDEAAEKRASASERLIADAIMWELAKVNFDIETIILIQGPLLPKLRGRLLYRGISDKVSIWTLTWHPKSFRSLEAAEILARALSDENPISPVYPPRGIDRASRCWVCRLHEKLLYHLELITNTWDCAMLGKWEELRVKEILTILDTVDKSIALEKRLPKALWQARDLAKDSCTRERRFVWFLPQLRACKNIPESLDESSDAARIVRLLDPAATQKDELFAASSTFDWHNEQNVYNAFKQRWRGIKMPTTS